MSLITTTEKASNERRDYADYEDLAAGGTGSMPWKVSSGMHAVRMQARRLQDISFSPWTV